MTPTERRGDQLLEALPLMAAELDADGRHAAANAAYAAFLGAAPRALEGRSLAEAWGGGYAALRAAAESALAGAPACCEADHFGPAGPRRVLATFVPHRGASGAPDGGWVFLSPVASPARAPEDRLDVGGRFFALADSAPVGLWTSGPDGLRNFCNQTWLRFTGRALTEELGNGWTQGVHPEDLGGLRDLYASSVAMRREFTLEYRLRRADGQYRWVLGHGVPYYRRDGRWAGYIGSTVDITDLKRAEALLRLSQAGLEARVAERTAELSELNSVLQATLESTAEGVLVVDLAGKMTRFNKNFSRMWGIPSAILEKKDDKLALAFVLEQLSDPKAFLEKVRELYTAPEAESRDDVHFKDGRVFERHSRPQRIGERTVGRVWSFLDVTARRQAERALRRAVSELESSNTDLEQFAYAASHDLQEPLRMMSSFAQLLAKRYRGRLDADADEFIGFIVEGAHRLQDMIDGLLSYSRIGAHGGERGPADCGRALDAALGNLSALVAESGARVEARALPQVLADPVELVQLFQNLVGNSIKYRSDQPPSIRVTAARRGALWELAVRDNGIGIDPAYSKRIFEIFQRLHGREKYPGSGVGLALCKKIVERGGGRIWVESEPGAGATFRFTLRAAEVSR